MDENPRVKGGCIEKRVGPIALYGTCVQWWPRISFCDQPVTFSAPPFKGVAIETAQLLHSPSLKELGAWTTAL